MTAVGGKQLVKWTGLLSVGGRKVSQCRTREEIQWSIKDSYESRIVGIYREGEKCWRTRDEEEE